MKNASRAPERMRFFTIVNALVLSMMTRMGRVLADIIGGEP